MNSHPPEIIGTFDEVSREQSTLTLTLFERLNFKWAHCDMTAQYLARYLTGAAQLDAPHRAADVSDSINYVANELIENAVKSRSFGDILIRAKSSRDGATMNVANRIASDTVDEFKASLRELLQGDLQQSFIERIEHNALHPDEKQPGLGFLTIMLDHNARLGWLFEVDPTSGTHLVTVSAHLATAQ